MAKLIYVVEATRSCDDSGRADVVCPRCKERWCSIAIQTSAGLYFDVVECDCGAELTVSPEIEVAITEWQKTTPIIQQRRARSMGLEA